MEFHKDFEHCTIFFDVYAFFQHICKKMFWRQQVEEEHLCWNVQHVLVETYVFIIDECLIPQRNLFQLWIPRKHVYNDFIRFVLVAPLMTWGWHRIFIVVKRGTPLLHLVSKVKLCRKFCDMVSSICWFGNLQIPNVQLMVNWWLGARWFGILGVPLNNPFHTEILGIQTTK